jgi:hypothetical protein
MPSHAKPPNPLTKFFIVSSIWSSHLMCWLSPASIPLCYTFSIVSMMKFSTSSSFAAPDLVAMAYDLPGCLRVMLQCVLEARNLGWFAKDNQKRILRFRSLSGWWFGTWLLFSPIVGMMIQSDELIFFRGVGIPPTTYSK